MPKFTNLKDGYGYYDSERYPYSCRVHPSLREASQADDDAAGLVFGMKENASLLYGDRAMQRRVAKHKVLNEQARLEMLEEALAMATRLRKNLTPLTSSSDWAVVDCGD